jgi:hypothetical protein
MKIDDLSPDKIVYRVDVYQKNQIGQFKGYYDTYMSALFETEHDVIVSELQDMQPHSQVTMYYVDKKGEMEILETYYFI